VYCWVMLDPKDEIKQKVDLVELIGESLTLKPAGAHGFKANCPFHGEKTPSFHVSSDRQIWHCFGCGEGGDCFSFIMKMEGMDFSEALLHLGQKVGVEVKRLSTTHGNIKQRLFEINAFAERFYRKVLEQSPVAETARAYVKNRGIPPELSERFGLGYAADQWDALTQLLLKRGFSESEIIAAGLGQKRKSGSGTIDRFRSRLMVPLRDQHGNTVGFTGRVLPGLADDKNVEGPKYMNSPETAVYHKGQLLYGLEFAKRASKEHKQMIVVEGNLDVIASHKAGVEHAVASSGTALTPEQLQLIGRYVKTVVFCFDRDAAGLQAAKRGVTIARSLGFDARAIVLPEGAKDPDELVQRDPSAWRELCARSVPFMEYLIGRVTEGKNLADVDDKRLIAQELLPALAEIKDPVEYAHWEMVVADLLGIEQSQIRRSIGQRSQLQDDRGKQGSRDDIHSQGTGGVSKPRTKAARAWLLLLGAWVNGLCDPPTHSGATVDELYTVAKEVYTSHSYAPKQPFFSRLREHLARQGRDDLVSRLDEASLFAQMTFSDLSPLAVQPQLKSLEEVLKNEQARAARQTLAQKIRQAELAGDHEAVERLIVEFTYGKKEGDEKKG